jgi:hypothetical protein
MKSNPLYPCTRRRRVQLQLVSSFVPPSDMVRDGPPLVLLQLGTVPDRVSQTSTLGTGGTSCSGVGILDRSEEGWDPTRCQLEVWNGVRDGTHFCLASMRRYLRSSSVCSAVCMLTNVVAIPVFPDLPVLPI